MLNKQRLLHHYNFLELICKRRDELVSLITLSRRRLIRAPLGSLKSINKGNFFQYYQRNNQEKTEKYIRKSNFKLIAALAQKKYDTKFISAAEAEVRQLNHFLDSYCDKIPYIYSSFNKELKGVIKPSDMNDDDYIEYWMSLPYTPKKISDDSPIFITDKGEQVRSKSEIMIANTLNKMGIPYKYECPIVLADGSVRYPDFTILIVESRKEMFYEHFGMMDDVNYQNNCFKKIRDYEASGYYPGIHYFMTFESSLNPLSSLQISKTLKAYTSR